MNCSEVGRETYVNLCTVMAITTDNKVVITVFLKEASAFRPPCCIRNAAETCTSDYRTFVPRHLALVSSRLLHH